MTERQNLIQQFEQLRNLFPNVGFAIGVLDLDSNVIWGWSNLKQPQPVFEWLSRQEDIPVSSVLNN